MGKRVRGTHLQALVDAYLDGELSRRERRQVEAHLRDCARCRAELEAQQRLHRVLRALPKLSCPEEVLARIQARYAPQVVRRRRLSVKPRLAWRLAVVGAVVTVALLAVVTHQPWQRQRHYEEVHYTNEQVLQARREVEVALAYVHYALRLTERTLEEEVLPAHVVKPLKRGVTTAFGVLTQEGKER